MRCRPSVTHGSEDLYFGMEVNQTYFGEEDPDLPLSSALPSNGPKAAAADSWWIPTPAAVRSMHAVREGVFGRETNPTKALAPPRKALSAEDMPEGKEVSSPVAHSTATTLTLLILRIAGI